MTNTIEVQTTMTSARAAPSPVMILFARWKEVADWVDGVEPATDEELTAGAERKWALGDAILALPSTDAQDHLAKVVVATSWGAHDLEDDGSAEFWAEAKALLDKSL